MSTIPASDIVSVNPGVISSGGNPLALNGVMLTKNTLLPTGAARSFASAALVAAFFGASSTEAALAQVYFGGYDTKTSIPGALYFAPYVDTARAAFLQSGSLAGMSLAQLQAIPAGTLTVDVDGTPFTSASINLSGATSFTNAATLIAAGFTGTGAPTCAWNATNSTFTLTSTTTGATSTITYATGTLAASLEFTAATGAILSQGAAPDTPTSAMNTLKASTQNWGTFMTVWEPVLADKEAFGAWASTQNSRYLGAIWDTDAQAIVQGSTTCFGAVAKAQAYDGVIALYNTKELAAFVLGMVASIDFARPGGRITGAFKSQGGLVPTVTDEQTASNLLANGYSFYGTYGTGNQGFTFLYDGAIPGKWKWLDTFIDQIYLNSQFQVALLGLMTNVGAIPYNEPGYSLIRAAMKAPIDEAISFGTIRTGVALSAAQAAQVNQAAGASVASIIEAQGYYLQVLDPGATVRAARGTPIVNFWYTDGGAVQKLTVASIDII